MKLGRQEHPDAGPFDRWGAAMAGFFFLQKGRAKWGPGANIWEGFLNNYLLINNLIYYLRGAISLWKARFPRKATH
jgi:hypothetical protein